MYIYIYIYFKEVSFKKQSYKRSRPMMHIYYAYRIHIMFYMKGLIHI